MAYRLLVMDDSVTIRRVVELTFAGGDVEVTSVGDGRAAMDRIAAEPPDVILADVGTTQPDGYEVSAYVKGDPALAHIPVLLLTGAFQPIDEDRALASRCDGVLAKPFDPGAVAARVRQALRVPEVAGAGSSGDGHAEAPPAAVEEAGTEEDLLAFFARLLAEPETDGTDCPGRISKPATGPAPVPGFEIRPELPLEEYFDLVDELLARTATAPSPSRGAPPRPPRPSSTACSGCPRGSTAS